MKVAAAAAALVSASSPPALVASGFAASVPVSLVLGSGSALDFFDFLDDFFRRLGDSGLYIEQGMRSKNLSTTPQQTHLCLLDLRLEDLLDFRSLDLLLDLELLDLLLLLFLRPDRPSSLDEDSVDESSDEEEDSSELASELSDPSDSEEELLSEDDLK